MARSWYLFINNEDPTDVSNYYRISNVTHNCLCGYKICVIYATGINRLPDDPLSANMQKYILDALATGQLQPEYPIGSRKYVYLKDY